MTSPVTIATVLRHHRLDADPLCTSHARWKVLGGGERVRSRNGSWVTYSVAPPTPIGLVRYLIIVLDKEGHGRLAELRREFPGPLTAAAES